MTTSTFASTTKCSKPAGQYCRIHNPAPAQRYDKKTFLSNFGINLAAKVKKPATGGEFFDKLATLPEGEEYDKARSAFEATPDGLKTLREEVISARKNLYDTAEQYNIPAEDVYGHVHGNYVTVGTPEVVKAFQKFFTAEQLFTYADDQYMINMREYRKKLVKAEFETKKDREDADFAIINRHAFMETTDDEEQMVKMYNSLGHSRETFFTKVSEPLFASKLRNIERLYLEAATGSSPSETTLDTFAAERKYRVTNVPQYMAAARASDFSMFKTSPLASSNFLTNRPHQ